MVVAEQRGQQGAEGGLFAIAVEQFQGAAETMGLHDGLRRILSECQHETTVNFPVVMDDGSVRMFRGHRSSTIRRVGRRKAAFGITRT